MCLDRFGAHFARKFSVPIASHTIRGVTPSVSVMKVSVLRKLFLKAATTILHARDH